MISESYSVLYDKGNKIKTNLVANSYNKQDIMDNIKR